MIYYIALKVGLGLRTLKKAQWTIINQDCGLFILLLFRGPLGLRFKLRPNLERIVETNNWIIEKVEEQYYSKGE